MAQLQCPCGYTHDMTENVDTSWITVHENEYSSMIKNEISAQDGDDDAMSQVVQKHGVIYSCPQCQRIMWQKPGESLIHVYAIEDAV